MPTLSVQNRRHFDSPFKYSSRRGFTVLELLTVLSIIALLLAILFPVFGSVREHGRRTVCTSNLHQIGLAVAQYKTDYDGAYPRAADMLSKPPSQSGDEDTTQNPAMSTVPYLWDVIQPYAKSRQIFDCPSDTGTDNTGKSSYDRLGSSYAVTSLLSGETDACWSNQTNLTYALDFQPWHSGRTPNYLDSWSNHLYLDGHVAYANAPDTQLALGKLSGGCNTQ